MTVDLVALKEQDSAARHARARRSLDQETQSVVRVLPIRWRLLLIAALNVVVASILALLIWNGANVLSRAWDDVRTVRESDKLLVLLESEASRLQNLIHRYINQPSQEVLTEILGLHGEVLSTLRNRGAVDPVLSGSTDELRAVTERFLQCLGAARVGKIARGVHREPRRCQCVLPVAGIGRRRRGAQKHHHRRADDSGDDRPRG